MIQITTQFINNKKHAIMKKVDAVQNFLNVLTEHNFVNLYQVRNLDTNKCESICFLSKDEALSQLHFMIKTGLLKNGRYYIAETCVYFG